MSEKATGRDSAQFLLRLPDGMRDRLKAAAETNNRSMNAEIVSRLEMTLETDLDSTKKLDEWMVWLADYSALHAMEKLAKQLGLIKPTDEEIARDPEGEDARSARAKAFYDTLPPETKNKLGWPLDNTTPNSKKP